MPLLAAAALLACDPFSGIDPELELCLDGPCGSGAPASAEFVILGFPLAGVDRDAIATGGGLVFRLDAGDTVALHFVRVPPHGVPLMAATDTLRDVAWSVIGPATSIGVGSDGIARLTATGPGVTTAIEVNGTQWPMMSCGAAPADGCFRVGEVSVE